MDLVNEFACDRLGSGRHPADPRSAELYIAAFWPDDKTSQKTGATRGNGTKPRKTKAKIKPVPDEASDQDA